MSGAMRDTGTSLAEKAEQERKRSQNEYAPMLRVLSCVLLTGKVKLFLEVEMKRERERVLGKREYVWLTLVRKQVVSRSF